VPTVAALPPSAVIDRRRHLLIASASLIMSPSPGALFIFKNAFVISFGGRSRRIAANKAKLIVYCPV
jgi:hypothetical protein